MSHKLEVSYRGSNLSLEFSSSPLACLRINGLVREEAAGDRKPVTLKVASTVQTDYEWHEFIEGIVDYREGKIAARLVANSQELASDIIDEGTDP